MLKSERFIFLGSLRGSRSVKPDAAFSKKEEVMRAKGWKAQGWVGGKVGGKITTATVPVLPAAVHR